MLLDEDPATLIHHTIGNFNIHPDRNALGRVNDSLSTLQQARGLRIRESESILKKLARNLSALESHHNETIASHSSTGHASEVLALDAQKFRAAKTTSDLEVEGERLEQELDGLKTRLQELELQGIDGSEAERGKRDLSNETILKLKVYQGLGIEIERDAAGNYSKAVVHNTQKDDTHIVHMDPKFSRFFYANYFWQRI
ncbi:MAG: kinetochore-associated Ndc80 complex subunit spc24 [Vezdaea aestivalis]|nr:MAG: kinetochore-associated Ndc80 complex subunit spc24 [Vezdaea aestivalis]